MSWRVARSLEQLRDQINEAYPNRSKASDGTIGDAAHATTDSDHNPWVTDGAAGVVTALDITHDPAHGCDCNKIVAKLVASRDPRIKYIIWDERIWRSYDKPGIPKWTPAAYTGSNPHDHHFHLSVQPAKRFYDSTRAWSIRAAVKQVQFQLWVAKPEAEQLDRSAWAVYPGKSRFDRFRARTAARYFRLVLADRRPHFRASIRMA
jgi:hypothetical protein